jgi:hypothetical protein
MSIFNWMITNIDTYKNTYINLSFKITNKSEAKGKFDLETVADLRGGWVGSNPPTPWKIVEGKGDGRKRE